MYDERRTNRPAACALVLALLSALALIAAGPLHRTGQVSLTASFTLLKWAVYGSVAALVLAVIGAFSGRRARGMGTAVTAIAIVLLSLGALAILLRQAVRVPPIHDVSTDLESPPVFVAVASLRSSAPNSIEYGGAKIAAQQRQGYPDIAPATLAVPPAQAFDRALATVRSMGWQLVASDPASGRIEATDTTFWFGFKDDIVVRVAPAPGGSRVDVRSLSRVGVGDIGTNAARIRKYLAALAASP